MRRNKSLWTVFGLLLATVVLIMLGQFLTGQESTSTKNTTTENKKEVNTYDDENYHLADNSALYETTSRTDVRTMYLTIGSGTQSDNTNHTWSEVNGLSVYDYEKMGVARYKVNAILQVGDENGPTAGALGYDAQTPNVTVQVRGQSSSRNVQKNYKIAIKSDKGTYYGQTTINLNKHQTDGLRFRNMMAYTLLQDIPQLLSLRTEFVHLYVKDPNSSTPDQFVDYGLYTQVEQLNNAGKKAHNLDTSGQLYKINEFEFYEDDDIKLTSDSDYDKEAFEAKIEIKGSDDHTKLIDLIDKVNNSSLDFDEVLDENLDRTNLAYWMAFNILMGNHDTQSRNMYLYSPLNSERWYFIPWDNDGSLFANEYKIRGKLGDADWETGISNYWGNLLFRRALKTESFRNELKAAVEDLRNNYITDTKVVSLSTELSSVVKPYLTSQPDNQYWGVTSTQYQEVLDGLPSEINQNRQSFYDSFEKPMPFFIGTPTKAAGKMKLSWDASYDFDKEDITYTVEVSTDYNFATTIFKQENISLTSVTTNLPAAGQYYVRVKATNESGKSQYAFDYYVTSDSQKVTGVKSFFVNSDGSIKEDTHESN
ncbi:CotH kinase family protein [Streptococcus loxodontisalivarius]|uniref:Spore coat protein H n=1 Tax=Streptococcus loxodontisalivarius TaxID=1349415 RepID=A0ABS2PU07_9STRE|nr:CotH kinase family protein [Streptococcus loxodontisalivarius]MBM7642964.1 spore coat protein H [Streptococcus loxodontisalivarius]